ncbi:MAG: outer membrane beta-barrel protein [Bacteroidales bacterium]|nr:outer membrane beta-barrel protein [Bacteroidales bacterium]
MNINARIALTCLVMLLSSGLDSRAQEESFRFDMGVGLGMAGYLGDLNESNPYRHPGFTGDLALRYRPDTRWAFRSVLALSSLSGNSADLASELPDNAVYSFKSTVVELSERVEFNFFSFGIGETYKHLRRWSPYLALGAGVAIATCQGSTHAAFTIPMGVGVKYKVGPKLTAGIEFSMTKAFSDHFDGDIADLYHIKSSFIKNTDWYSRLAVSLSYEFGLRCPTCHYYD